eukprot:gnl/Dysnectes_brevis/2485_a2971_1627.p1 GENE.gnl/Dysnectes_brevis/2485_a2971_1627~~gnl/Dysnectes_brevis/2485_a2971_1627.p1  ORF type:complete len:285 (+),score=15.91 gnl/Dysnectes_brevis/2485_a2971_1627:102-956(+)
MSSSDSTWYPTADEIRKESTSVTLQRIRERLKRKTPRPRRRSLSRSFSAPSSLPQPISINVSQTNPVEEEGDSPSDHTPTFIATSVATSSLAASQTKKASNRDEDMSISVHTSQTQSPHHLICTPPLERRSRYTSSTAIATNTASTVDRHHTEGAHTPPLQIHVTRSSHMSPTIAIQTDEDMMIPLQPHTSHIGVPSTKTKDQSTSTPPLLVLHKMRDSATHTHHTHSFPSPHHSHTPSPPNSRSCSPKSTPGRSLGRALAHRFVVLATGTDELFDEALNRLGV